MSSTHKQSAKNNNTNYFFKNQPCVRRKDKTHLHNTCITMVFSSMVALIKNKKLNWLHCHKTMVKILV